MLCENVTSVIMRIRDGKCNCGGSFDAHISNANRLCGRNHHACKAQPALATKDASQITDLVLLHTLAV